MAASGKRGGFYCVSCGKANVIMEAPEGDVFRVHEPIPSGPPEFRNTIPLCGWCREKQIGGCAKIIDDADEVRRAIGRP